MEEEAKNKMKNDKDLNEEAKKDCCDNGCCQENRDGEGMHDKCCEKEEADTHISESRIADEKDSKEPVNEKRVYKIKLEKKDQEIEKIKADMNHWKNEYYRSYADVQNLRKSIERDHQEAIKYRAEGFIDKLLPVMDGFHMALANEPNSPELKNYLVGFQYIYNNLLQALESEGVAEVSPKIGDKFDVQNMHAIDSVEQDGEENLVVKVFAKGYILKDHLIRPSMVVVSKHKALEEDKKEEKKECQKEE
ncbi:MAG: nucleotide exchange factor GrpE [Bacilli bacterium]|jgi:molecular chaperone GrpE